MTDNERVAVQQEQHDDMQDEQEYDYGNDDDDINLPRCEACGNDVQPAAVGLSCALCDIVLHRKCINRGVTCDPKNHPAVGAMSREIDLTLGDDDDIDGETAEDFLLWWETQSLQLRKRAEEERELILSYGPACTECEMIIIRPEEPLQCTQRRCNAFLHMRCVNDHELICEAFPNNACSAPISHPESWLHVTPPPPMWTHNACGPESINEVCGMLLRCVKRLRPLLPRATLKTLDSLADMRSQPPAITRQTPWQMRDKCHCGGCITDGATAQDHYLQKQLYKHMNTHRTDEDQLFEEMGRYIVGEFTDVRRMVEATLGLRSLSKRHKPLPGLGLCVVYKCYLCGHTKRPPGSLELNVSDSASRRLPGQPAACSTQQLVDQMIGKDSILDHLPLEKSEHLNLVRRWGGVCKYKHSEQFQNTMLPLKLNSEQPLPPVIRVTKGLYSLRFSEVSDTLTITDQHGVDVVYKLLAVVYGNHVHFTCCVRYHIDSGDERFYHFDSYHFKEDRLLRLSGNLPACMGGTPTWLPRHTQAMRNSFNRHTGLNNVAQAVYGIVDPSPPMNDQVISVTPSSPPLSPPSSPSSAPSSPDNIQHDQCTTASDTAASSTVQSSTASSASSSSSSTYSDTQLNTTALTTDTYNYIAAMNRIAMKEAAIARERRTQAAKTAPVESSTPSSTADTWACPCCTWSDNTLAELFCGVCASEQPQTTESVYSNYH